MLARKLASSLSGTGRCVRKERSRAKMKHKLSVTLDEELVNEIVSALSSGKFRNKSHLVEYALQKLMEEQDGRA